MNSSSGTDAERENFFGPKVSEQKNSLSLSGSLILPKPCSVAKALTVSRNRNNSSSSSSSKSEIRITRESSNMQRDIERRKKK